mgnify:FL=1
MSERRWTADGGARAINEVERIGIACDDAAWPTIASRIPAGCSGAKCRARWESALGSATASLGGVHVGARAASEKAEGEGRALELDKVRAFARTSRARHAAWL